MESGWQRRPRQTPDGFAPGGIIRRTWQRRRRNAVERNLDQGVARWATYEDVRDYGADLVPSTDGRIYLGEFSEPRRGFGSKKVDIFSHPDHNVLIEAPAGAGKTNLMELTVLRHLGPVIATSVRTDILDHTYTERLRRGPVYIFAPGITDLPYPTDHWSPLQYVHSWADAEKSADLLVASADTNVKDQEKNKAYFNDQARIMLAPMLFAVAMAREVGPILQVDSNSADIAPVEVPPSMSTIGEWVLEKNFRTANSILYNVTASSRGVLDVVNGVRRGQTFPELQQETEQMIAEANQRISKAKQSLPASNDRSKRAETARDAIQNELVAIRDTLIYPAQGRDAAIKRFQQGKQLPSEWDQMEKEARSRISQARQAEIQLNAAFNFEGEGETGAGAYGTVRSILKPYSSAESHMVRDMRDIDIGRVLEQNGTIYIIGSEESQGTYRAMMQAFLGKAVSLVQERDRTGKKLPGKVMFALDELAQFGLLKNLPDVVNTSRDRGYGFVAAIQGNSQLKGHYGDDGAETIRRGFKTKVILGGGDDYREIAATVGDTRVTATTINLDRRGEVTGRSRAFQSIPLLSSALFQSFRKGEAVVLTDTFTARTRYPKVKEVYPDLWDR